MVDGGVAAFADAMVLPRHLSGYVFLFMKGSGVSFEAVSETRLVVSPRIVGKGTSVEERFMRCAVGLLNKERTRSYCACCFRLSWKVFAA